MLNFFAKRKREKIGKKGKKERRKKIEGGRKREREKDKIEEENE